jgi:hypothetical protein
MVLFRCHGDGTRGSKQKGSWFSDKPYKTPQEAVSNLALPNRPTHYSRVTVPAGTTVYKGVASPFKGNQGGGTQFLILKTSHGQLEFGNPQAFQP